MEIFLKRNWRRSAQWGGGLLILLSFGLIPVLAADETSDETAPAALSAAQLDAINKAVSDKLAASQSAFKVEVHGYAELDFIGDDTQTFKETIGNAPVAKPGTTVGDNTQLQASPRNSRLSFLAQAPEVEGWKSKGVLEFDFLGYDPAPNYAVAATNAAPANSESAFYSQPSVRIRHAYLDVQKDGWDIMAGQFWTLFGWQADYLLGTMIPGTAVMGELFQRTPQVRVMKTFGDATKIQISASADRPEESASNIPNFDGGVRISWGGLKGRFALATGPVSTSSLSLGLSGTLRNYAFSATTGTNVNLNQNVQGQAVAVDAFIPVLPLNDSGDGPSLVLTGEWTAGTGDGDQMLSWTGGLPALSAASTLANNAINLDPGVGGIDANGNFVLVDIQSWNGQLQFHFPKSWATFITAGYGEVFSDNVGGLTGGGASAAKLYNDDNIMFANVLHDFNANIRAGLEYDRFDTHYVTPGADVINHRVMVSGLYRF